MFEERAKETKARRAFEKLLDSVGSEDQEVLDRLMFDFAGKAMTRLHELGGPFLIDDYSAAIHARYDWARGVGPWGLVPLWVQEIQEETEAAFGRAASSFEPKRKKLLTAEYHTRAAVLSSMNRNPYDGIKGVLRHLSLMTPPAKEVWDQATQDLQEALKERNDDKEHFTRIKSALEDTLFENNPSSNLSLAQAQFLASLMSQESYKENPPLPKTLERPTALFQHLGAKNQLWPEIIKILLRIGTSQIAEPFAGSAVVSRNYGAKKVYLAEQNSEIREILIRLRDGDIEQLFRQMLLFEVDPEDRTEIYPEGVRAAKGLHKRIFHDPLRGAWKNVTDKALLAKKKVMEEAQRAFKDAEIYDDALELIEDYAADKGITWFLDPPYPEACHVGYGEHGKCYDMNDYKALMNATAKIRGPVIITGYENMRPPKRLRCKEIAIKVVNRIAKKGTTQIEYIWWREGQG